MLKSTIRNRALSQIKIVPSVSRIESHCFRSFYQAFGLSIESHQEEWLTAIESSSKIRLAAPRNSGKTTFLIHRLAWEIGRTPSIRIIIASATDDIARSISIAIRRIIDTDVFKEIFPKILPLKRWSEKRWSIDRVRAGISTVIKDPTVLAVGASGSIVSRRADLIVIDDPIKNSDIIATEKSRGKMRRWWHEVLAPTGDPSSRIWVLCTRYRVDDIHATDFSPPQGFTVIEQPALIEGKSYWEKRFPSSELIAIRERNPITFSSQYQNNPIREEGAIFKPEWIKIVKEGIPSFFEAIAIGVDLAASKSEEADFTAMVAIGRKENCYWVIRSIRGKWSIHEGAQKLFNLYQELESITINITASVESVAMQAALIIEYKRLALEKGVLIRIEKDIPKGSKEQRMRGIAPLLEAGKVFFLDPSPELIIELLNFGVETHDDLADAFEKALRKVFSKRKSLSGGVYNY